MQAAETMNGATNRRRIASLLVVENCGWSPIQTAFHFMESALAIATAAATH